MAPVKVYVASSWSNREAVREVYHLLAASGYAITFDWTHCDEENVGLEGDALLAKHREHALSDLRGVAASDIVIVLNHPLAKSTFTEMGMALAAGKAVIVLDAFTVDNPNVFFHLPEVIHASNRDEMLNFVKFRAEHRHRINTIITVDPGRFNP